MRKQKHRHNQYGCKRLKNKNGLIFLLFRSHQWWEWLAKDIYTPFSGKSKYKFPFGSLFLYLPFAFNFTSVEIIVGEWVSECVCEGPIEGFCVPDVRFTFPFFLFRSLLSSTGQTYEYVRTNSVTQYLLLGFVLLLTNWLFNFFFLFQFHDKHEYRITAMNV